MEIAGAPPSPEPFSPGAVLEGGCCRFEVWAPNAAEVALHLVHPEDRLIAMKPDDRGCYRAVVHGLRPGARYFYRLNGKSDLPDPASRFQPLGVHGPSELIDPDFLWSDSAWRNPPLADYIIYELHTGTFTPEGSFDAIITELPRLADLGVTAIEIMPVAQFPGTRNWGYDGVGLYAVQNSYGGPAALKRLVNAAHQHGLAVILDVVYNHLGPEGNYLPAFGPYFTDTYKTPWGPALNFDGPHSDQVRRFFIENALYWQREFHLDALRLDAVHAIRDVSAIPFLRELSEATRQQAEQLNRPFYLIAESDLNAPRFILPAAKCGYGMDAQWADDFHHCLHVLLTGEKRGYYEDYLGGVQQFAKTWREGYAYTGEFSPYRKTRHGDVPLHTQLKQFVVCAQNHDQIGNRMTGDRLTASLDLDRLKLAAASVLLSPFVPLLFMGEEYAEPAPFQYFVDHQDQALLEAVRHGRREEFASFAWSGTVPDPASPDTFARCRLNPALAREGRHKIILNWYRELIRFRRSHRSFARADRSHLTVLPDAAKNLLAVHYHLPDTPELLLVFSFYDQPAELALPEGNWKLALDSTAPEWNLTPPEHRISLRSGTIRIPPCAVAVLARDPER